MRIRTRRAARPSAATTRRMSTPRASPPRRPGTSTRSSSLELGLSYEEQSLYHPIVDRILVDFDGPGPAPPVEVFSLLVDTDHRDVGAMLRYNRRVGEHDMLAGVNFGDGRVEGGNYRNDGGQRNGLTERVDNSADSLEAYRRRSLAAERRLDAGLRRAVRRCQPRRPDHGRCVRAASATRRTTTRPSIHAWDSSIRWVSAARCSAA